MSIDLMKEKGFTLKKRQEADVENITNDIKLLSNTPTASKSLMHSLEQIASCIDFHGNADKIKHMCFN